MRSPSVAVVGGGYAGLSAARRLVGKGFRVTLIERSGHLGGLAMTLPLGGTGIEKYYHHWFTSDDHIVRVVEELGLGDCLEWRSPVMGMFCQGRLYRFMSPTDLIAFRPFSWPAKVRFGLVTLFLQRYPHARPFEGETASAWLRRWAGRQVYDTMWGPLLRAKFGRHAEEVSMAWIWNKMRLRGRSRARGGLKESLGYMRGGFGVLTEAMANDIRAQGGELRTAERVLRIARDGKGFQVETTARRERFDGVVSTVAPPLLANLAPDLPATFRSQCEGIEHAAILCTMLVLRESFSPIYWMNVSDPEIPFGGVIEHTNFVPPDRYGGQHVVYLSHYLYEDQPEWQMGAQDLLDAYLPGLRRIRPGFGPESIERMMVFRDRFAQPIVTRDYHERLLPIESPWRGLVLATMAHVYPEDRGTNYAVGVGEKAADRLAAILPAPQATL